MMQEAHGVTTPARSTQRGPLRIPQGRLGKSLLFLSACTAHLFHPVSPSPPPCADRLSHLVFGPCAPGAIPRLFFSVSPWPLPGKLGTHSRPWDPALPCLAASPPGRTGRAWGACAGAVGPQEAGDGSVLLLDVLCTGQQGQPWTEPQLGVTLRAHPGLERGILLF